MHRPLFKENHHRKANIENQIQYLKPHRPYNHLYNDLTLNKRKQVISINGCTHNIIKVKPKKLLKAQASLTRHRLNFKYQILYSCMLVYFTLINRLPKSANF